MSRDKILAAVKENQPQVVPLPTPISAREDQAGLTEKFASLVIQIGGRVFDVEGVNGIDEIIRKEFPNPQRIVSVLPELGGYISSEVLKSADPHTFHDVGLAVIQGHFGVAENGAVWITDKIVPQRVLPFIAQHLAIVVYKNDIVGNMHIAYERIGTDEYDFGTFIAGPSKTADIEQSLVLGAHGPRSLTIFLQ